MPVKIVLTLLSAGFLTLFGIQAFTRFTSMSPRAAPQPVVAQATGPVDEALAAARADRSAQLDDLHERAAVVRSARLALVAQAADLANVSERITAAIARATDEDRWPVKVAGRTLERADADALMAKVSAVLATESRAVDHDAAALARITAAEAALHGELVDIDRLRQQEPSTDVQGQAEAYRDRSPHLPDPADLTPDPARPIDLSTLLK